MSAQILASAHLLSENVRTEKYRNVILPVVLYGCVTWSLTLRQEHRLRVLREILGVRGEKGQGTGENCVMGSLMIRSGEPYDSCWGAL
jgi:hypothetical protein